MGTIHLHCFTALIYQILAFRKGRNAGYNKEGHVSVASVAAAVIIHLSWI